MEDVLNITCWEVTEKGRYFYLYAGGVLSPIWALRELHHPSGTTRDS